MRSIILVLLVVFALTPLVEAKQHRSRSQRAAFVALNPCPATGETRGACPGYHVDHIKALVCGGEDRPENMQWMTTEDHKRKTRRDVKVCYRP